MTLLSPPDKSRKSAAERQPGGRRRIYVAVLGLLGLSVGTFLAGYVLFAIHVASIVADPEVKADGIVVLTGGRERISGALELLQGGRAQRLLISGVHPATTPRQIIRLTESEEDIFTCCVDLDRRAMNTIGNAQESRKWAERNGFHSLIVVTSAYHMPRGILELRRAMPDMRFLPYPIFARELNLPHWYAKAPTMKLLMREYVKYIVAWLRSGVEPVRPKETAVSGATAKP
ncbi:YdcF family protein [Breoghania sp.]|uniref:YdcF family protein n=1 Tax=Breoghania sp. TaxID=2065378 RepID=UPI0029C9C97B|nr:YdcF family protein [Breoghania sp.]